MKKLFGTLALALSLVGGFSAAAGAADCPDSSAAAVNCTTEVKDSGVDAPVAQPEVAAPVTPAIAAQESLPVTGVETVYLAGAGLTLIAGGALLVAKSRKEIEPSTRYFG